VLLHFVAFLYIYGTNLLTRCHSASFYFLLFLCFRKVTREIFSELDKTKAKVPFFPDTRQSPKQRLRGARGRPHHPLARPRPGPRLGMVWALGPLPDIAPPPIYSPRRENPKHPINFLETYHEPPSSSTQDWEGPEALPGTLPERRITTRGLLHHQACLRSDA
jgi:hypothetical protein